MINPATEGVMSGALSLVGTVGIGALFLYVRSIKADVKEVACDLRAFKNGHFQDHIIEAEKRGQEKGLRVGTENMLNALHARVDTMEIRERA